MEEFLIQLGTMSLQASIVVAVVVVLRFLFTKLHISKKYTMLLWLIPYICMICPWKFGAPFSFWGKGETLFSKLSRIASSIEYQLFVDPYSQPLVGSVGQNSGNTDVLTQGQLEQAGQLAQEGQIAAESIIAGQAKVGSSWFENVVSLFDSMTMSDFLYVGLFTIWLIGFLLVGGYCLFSYWKLKKRLMCSVPDRENIYYADDIDTAFVVGYAKPKIYLPSGMQKEHATYVVEHEKTHIKRFDPLKKLLALMITCVHWFNPVVWFAFMLMGKDMEMTCDEETVARLGVETKKDYANALLQLSAAKGPMLGAPLAFGEGNTKDRIKNIVGYKKTIWIVSALAVVVIAVVALGFLGRTSDITTLGSGEVEWITFPENRTVPVTVLYSEGNETKFIVFPDSYGEELIRYLEQVEVELNPVTMSRAEDRPMDVSIRVDLSDYFYFNEDMSEVWYENGVKPTYSYKVVDPKALREFVESQLDSITEVEKTSVSEMEGTEASPETEIQTGDFEVSIAGYSHDHSLYETFGVGEYYTLAASYEANLNHDEDAIGTTTDEVIEVYTGNTGDGDSGFVLFRSGDSNDPYSIEAHVARAGWKSIYLIDGEEKDYLLDLNLEIREGFGKLSYMVYYFGEQLGPKIPVVVEDGAVYSYEADTFETEDFKIWAAGMEAYLKEAQLLLSTQDGELRVGPANDLKRYNTETILAQIQESVEGVEGSEMEVRGEIEYGYPAIPYYESDDEVTVDATETSLDYADENIVIFHHYFGLFVYDMNQQALIGAVALEPIGCNFTQGDNYCEVMVDSAGTTVYLHPLQEKEMYVYDVATGTLTQQEYNRKGIEIFDNFDIKEDIEDWDATIFQTRNIVPISKNRWIHLESGSGLVQDLAVVVTKNGEREAYLKVFENYNLQVR